MLVSAIDGDFLFDNCVFKPYILGLSKGYMDYAIDPVLPIVKQSIRNSVEKINKMSPEQ